MLGGAKRIVVKVGTSNLVNSRDRLDPAKVGKVVREVMSLRTEGREVILVSSGAIGAGVGRLNLPRWPSKLVELQAAAAVGQGILMQVYERHFGDYGQPISQVLLTMDDFTDQRRYRNLRNTLETLLSWGVVPIVNENDTVAVEEIKVGDNDQLAAYVAIGIDADLLIIMTDVDGLYTIDPKRGRGELLRTVDVFDGDIDRLAGSASKGFGGMATKIKAARMVGERGIPTVIVNGEERDVLKRVLAGEGLGTLFKPRR